MNIKAQHQFGFLKTTISIALVSTLLLQSSLMGQEWQLGHQPTQYSVPQYIPQNENSIYPLPPEEIPDRPSELIQPAPTEINVPSQLPAPPDEGQSSQRQTSPELPGQVAPIEQNLNLPKPESSIQSESINRIYPAGPPSNNSGSNRQDSKKNQIEKRFGLDYSIYRDYNTYPVDPRKPCNQCTHPAPKPGLCNCPWPGKNGQPYREREPGGCDCSSASSKHHGNFSINWPGPFSALRESSQNRNHCGGQCNGQCNDPNRKRINDRFDHLANWKLIDYRRTDSGYTGIGSDPYGCEGESRVAGLQFRQPGQSVNDSSSAYPIR